MLFLAHVTPSYPVLQKRQARQTNVLACYSATSIHGNSAAVFYLNQEGQFCILTRHSHDTFLCYLGLTPVFQSIQQV